MLKLTDVEGVYAGGIHAGIKSDPLVKDLGYIYVPGAVGSAGVFTKNKVVSPTITYTRKQINKHVIKGMIVNSGNANAATGERGMQDVKKMAHLVADYLSLETYQVGVASTGIIGEYLPMDQVESGISALLKDSHQKNAQAFSESILTTDLTIKEASGQVKCGKKKMSVAGVTKGSGMIAPNMATTLTFLVTDAHLSSEWLHRFLVEAVERTFNMASVDTDTSTNDMVILISTGKYKFSLTDADAAKEYQRLLTNVCQDLVVQLIRDGEGATKLIRVDVSGAASVSDAKRISKSVVDSPLVKTAIHGEDPNWGRILMAVGKPEAIKLNEKKLIISLNDTVLFEDGHPTTFNKEAVREDMKKDTIIIGVELGIGTAKSSAWGCDLSAQYVAINTDYN